MNAEGRRLAAGGGGRAVSGDIAGTVIDGRYLMASVAAVVCRLPVMHVPCAM